LRLQSCKHSRTYIIVGESDKMLLDTGITT
jgi:hypothetical protein